MQTIVNDRLADFTDKFAPGGSKIGVQDLSRYIQIHGLTRHIITRADCIWKTKMRSQ